MARVEALNHAIRGLPEDRIRFHLCWGSWHGPHTTDIPMRDIVEVMLAVKCRAYSFEAGFMQPGEAPGLGVDIDEDLAAKHPYERAYLPVARKLDGTVHSW